MKRFFILLIVALILVSSTALAHPGRTDKYGGHTEKATGKYHFHHGHEPHEHINGVCPYGDYEEWLAEKGISANEAENAVADIVASLTDDDDGNYAWVIAPGGAAVAAAAGGGYAAYKKSTKKKNGSDEAESAKTEPNETEVTYDLQMKVYTANNGSRFHVVEGCCNAYVPMELGQALADDRFGCPCCCERNLIIFEMKQHGTYKEGMKVRSFVESEDVAVGTEKSAS